MNGSPAVEVDLAGLRVDDVVDGDQADRFESPTAVRPRRRRLTVFGLGRTPGGCRVVGRVRRVHGAQQRHGRELARLVDADAERVLLGDVDLDPAAALGDDAAGVQLAVAGLGLDDEVDAGRAVELADDDALGAVDDELAAADHDRHVAEVDLFLDRLLLVEAQPDAERPAVGQAQLPALVGAVARLAELVLDVLERDRLVVALDREDFAQHAFEAGRRRASRAAMSSCRKRS